MRFTAEEERAVLLTAGFSDPDAPEILALKHSYKSTPRYYHDWQHALNVLSWVNTAALKLFRPEVRHGLGMAALAHDAVYDVAQGSPENERQSANLLLGDNILARHLVMLTAQHGKPNLDYVSNIEAFFLDCDMAAFLCDPRWEVVLCNDRNIRKELHMKFSAEEVFIGRAAFLKKLYTRPNGIFLSDYFHQEHERTARQNLWHLVFGDLYKKKGK